MGARATRSLDAQNTGQKTVAVTNLARHSTGFFCARTDMEVHTTLAFFVNTLAFHIVSAYSTFTMCLHEHHYFIPEYNENGIFFANLELK